MTLMMVRVNLPSHALYQVCPGAQSITRGLLNCPKSGLSVNCLCSTAGRADFRYCLFLLAIVEAKSNAFPAGCVPAIQGSVYIHESKSVCCVCRSLHLRYCSFRSF